MKRNPGSRFGRRSFMQKLGALGVLGAAGFTGATNSVAAADESVTDHWSRQEAERIQRTDANTAPVIEEEVDKLSEDLYIWDTWPLRDRDGSITKVNGYQVIFSLTAPNDVVPGARHNLATIRYFYSKNGHDWELGGKVFDDPEGHH